MGQHCVKLGSKNAIYSVPSTGPGGSRNKDGTTSAMPLPAISVDQFLYRESHVKQLSSNPHILALIEQLSQFEVEILLVSKQIHSTPYLSSCR